MKAAKLFIFILVLINPLAFAKRSDDSGLDRPRNSYRSQKVFVDWVGVVSDDALSHTTEHDHDLKFTKKDDGKTYDIVDSPDLVKLHHETEKNLLIEMTAEKTSRFLFWGGNLIVKNFKVLEELETRLHQDPPKPAVSDRQLRDHGRNR